MTKYTTMIEQLLAIDDNIALGSGDPTPEQQRPRPEPGLADR